MRPGRAFIGREARRAISRHRDATRVLQRLARPGEIGAELAGIHGEDALMVPAMAGQLMPCSTIRRMRAG